MKSFFVFITKCNKWNIDFYNLAGCFTILTIIRILAPSQPPYLNKWCSIGWLTPNCPMKISCWFLSFHPCCKHGSAGSERICFTYSRFLWTHWLLPKSKSFASVAQTARLIVTIARIHAGSASLCSINPTYSDPNPLPRSTVAMDARVLFAPPPGVFEWGFLWGSIVTAPQHHAHYAKLWGNRWRGVMGLSTTAFALKLRDTHHAGDSNQQSYWNSLGCCENLGQSVWTERLRKNSGTIYYINTQKTQNVLVLDIWTYYT